MTPVMECPYCGWSVFLTYADLDQHIADSPECFALSCEEWSQFEMDMLEKETHGTPCIWRDQNGRIVEYSYEEDEDDLNDG